MLIAPHYTATSTRRRTRQELEDESGLKENLPTPPSTPKRKKTCSPPQTPQNIRHITNELERTQGTTTKEGSSLLPLHSWYLGLLKVALYLVSKPTTKQNETPQTFSSSTKAAAASATTTTATTALKLTQDTQQGEQCRQIPILARAKALFRRTAIPSRLVARDNERETMMDFWQTHVIGNRPGSLYISGSPGTGKTAMLMDIMRKSQDELDSLSTHKVQTVMINCMSVGEPKQIYMKLVTELKGPKTALSADLVQQAHQLLMKKKNTLRYTHSTLLGGSSNAEY